MTKWLRTSGIIALYLAMLMALGGCSLSGVLKGALSDSTPASTYDLVLDHSRIKKAGRLDTQLVVASPIAVRALAGDNILVKPNPTSITYYGRAVWSDRLPKLIQARLVEALRISSRFRAVSDGSDRITGDVTMASTIEAFQIEVHGEQAEALVIIYAKLIHVASGKVYASKKFTTRAPSPNKEVDGGVEALNQAMNDAIASITRWAVRRGRLRVDS